MTTKRKSTNYIVVHCSATKPDQDIGAATIRRWHIEKGWSDIGYHDVIKRNGMREAGRDLYAVGAHVAGYNSASVGVCLVGGIDKNGKPENNFTDAQFKTLKRVITDYLKLWPHAIVQGHRDFPGVAKDCPCFNVSEWWAEQ